MKEVVAVIRPEKWQETIDAAQAMGLNACSHIRVMGRGKQRGLRYMRPVNGSDDGVMHFLPKRMLTWLVPDEAAGRLVRSIITVNKADNFGDGKVFVCPVEEIILSPEESTMPETVTAEV
ncbi:Nitrogen fixation nifHD region glnB-like protein 2 [Geodia barretti]|uniref:Nitrogen fixation nifHD region glnB-like protein 2 n=1 Tax=Geodia barretti TaxID=519541 RepID=A0AA35RS49_GEOBA|nr:Nitrogen fixation nifHD region glnB-like protein 2 [Geodia barretti]